MNTVFLKSYSPPPVDKKEVLRYAGAYGTTPEIDALLEDCLKETEGIFSYQVCFREFSLKADSDVLDLSFLQTTSKDLQKNLSGCHSIIVFAATVGLGIDRLMARYSSINPARALMLSAIGAERIESLCNTFNEEISAKKQKEGLFTRPRFSPGYGDFPLLAQKDIFSVLDCPRKIGLTLNNSLIMSPVKSVTAIIGITECPEKNVSHTGCDGCKKTDCIFRRKR